MAKSVSINSGKPPYKSMEYEALLKEGIRYLQKYSGATWTDYNIHDPGVTILEYLCFGITDIGYRCNFPITDLLYSRENRKIATVDNAFYPPEKILPCATLINDDYRKLIIDRIPGIANVWVEPVFDQKEKFKGLYDVRLQINKERQYDRTPDQIKAEVSTLLAENRSLSEDIRNIHVLEQVYLEIEALVDLENDASTEQVLADIIHEIEHFLAPNVVFYNLEEMLTEGVDINELFDGPNIEHGYIKTRELRPMNTEINVSQIRDTIANTTGVRSIEQIRIKLNGLPHLKEEIASPSNTYFVLSETMKLLEGTNNHPIRFRRNNQTLKPNYFLAWQILSAHMAHDSQVFKDQIDIKNRPTSSEKDLTDIGAYYSIQRFFPNVYGIDDYGLPSHSSLARKAQARQLKGYLAIFETMFSSYLRQLTQVRHLFSIEDKNEKIGSISKKASLANSGISTPSYFARFPFDIPDIQSLIALGKNPKEAEVDKVLAQNTALQDQDVDRRNEFLDHLLARFGESLSAEWLNMFVNSPDDLSKVKKSLISTKCRILQEYEMLSRDRGKGFNYLLPGLDKDDPNTWVTNNVSGLKKSLSYLINLPSYADRCLTNNLPLAFFDIKKGTEQDDEAGQQAVKLPLKSILRNGLVFGNYEINKINKVDRYEVLFRETVNGQIVHHKLFELESRKEAK